LQCKAYEAFSKKGGNCLLFSQYRGLRAAPSAHGINKLAGSGYNFGFTPTPSTTITALTTTYVATTTITNLKKDGLCGVVASLGEHYDVSDCATAVSGSFCVVTCNGEAGWYGTPARFICLAADAALGKPPVPAKKDKVWPRCDKTNSKQNEETSLKIDLIAMLIGIPSVLAVGAGGVWWCFKRTRFAHKRGSIPQTDTIVAATVEA